MTEKIIVIPEGKICDSDMVSFFVIVGNGYNAVVMIENFAAADFAKTFFIKFVFTDVQFFAVFAVYPMFVRVPFPKDVFRFFCRTAGKNRRQNRKNKQNFKPHRKHLLYNFKII